MVDMYTFFLRYHDELFTIRINKRCVLMNSIFRAHFILYFFLLESRVYKPSLRCAARSGGRDVREEVDDAGCRGTGDKLRQVGPGLLENTSNPRVPRGLMLYLS